MAFHFDAHEELKRIRNRAAGGPSETMRFDFTLEQSGPLSVSLTDGGSRLLLKFSDNRWVYLERYEARSFVNAVQMMLNVTARGDEATMRAAEIGTKGSF